MFQGSPIPPHATVSDPLWLARFHDLANAMILCGAKGKLVTWATGLNSKQVTDRYIKLCGINPPLGRLGQADPKYFALRSHKRGFGWNIQCAIFTAVYQKMQESMTEPTHRGWLLYTAYDVYVQLTNGTVDKEDIIPFSNAYEIVAHTQGKQPTLKLHPCQDCGTNYLILTGAEIDNQDCPLCATGKRCDHLIKIGNVKSKKTASEFTVECDKLVESGAEEAIYIDRC